MVDSATDPTNQNFSFLWRMPNVLKSFGLKKQKKQTWKITVKIKHFHI